MSALKRCPLCGANCFGDMDTCYCCMFRFTENDAEEEEGEARVKRGVEWEAADKASGEDLDDVQGEELVEECGEVCREGFAEVRGEVADAARGAEQCSAGKPPCFAFGPSIELLSDIGDCIRIDIPLRAISTVMAAAAASAAASQVADLPPAA